MEDFGFKLQNIKNRNWFKRSTKIILIIFAIFILAIILIKTIDIISNDKSNAIETVILIKSQVKNIKLVPDQKGGLVVDNLDMNIYNVINNKEKEETNPILKKTKQDVSIISNNENNTTNEQELLRNKINEINENQNIILNAQEVEKVVDINNLTKKNKKIKSTTNIKINNNEKKITTDINELNKLGNKSLINNLKNKKDIKPGVKVQLLALKSKKALIEYWEESKNKYKNLFNDKNYYIEKFDLNRNGAIYRLQVGNFIDKNQANEFCKEYIELTNKNKVDCIIVKN